jgi:hypothetical protein
MTTIYLCRQYATSWLARCARPLLASCLMLFATVSHGQDLSSAGGVTSLASPNSSTPGNSSVAMSDHSDVAVANSQSDQIPDDDWVHQWLRMVDKTRSEQPHYVAPLVTTHVLLVQQFRFDSSWQTNANGSHTDNYGNGHGLEIIPNNHLEVQIAQPPYVFNGAAPNGFGDTSLFVKYRAVSAPEGEGDYFLGAFFGASFPTGNSPNGLGHTVLSPMIAMAKGWGRFDVQNTFSGSLPASGTNVLGRAFLWNTAFQYSIAGKIWPMIEQNSTFFSDGPHSGKKETFLTPGVVVGNFKIAERLHLGIGGGIQIAATDFHTYNHRWMWTVRLPF